MNYSGLTAPMNIATESSSKYNGVSGTTKSSRSGNMRARSRGTIRIVPSFFLFGIMPSHEAIRFLILNRAIDVDSIILVNWIENDTYNVAVWFDVPTKEVKNTELIE